MTKCPNCFVPVPLPPPAPARTAPRRRTDAAPDPSQAHTAPPPPRECPNPDCRRPYPPGWLNAGCTSIVMAGARAAGKSIFIAVMIKQLEQFATSVGMDVRPASPQVRQVFEQHYLNPLFVERGVMKYTPPGTAADAYQTESLVFTLTTAHGAHHHLVIRDVAGEDLETPDDQTRKHLAFFGHADAVFFLFDPLEIPEIVAQLRRIVPEQQLGKPAKEVLDTTLDLVSQGAPRLALIISKFDTLQLLRATDWSNDYTAIMQNAGAAFFRDPGPYGVPDETDSRLMHEEVRSLLMMVDQSPLVASVHRAGRRGGHRFFAVSALGDPPNGRVLNARGIAPFRCLDPLRWVLADTGVLA
jgi:hypothetical protein